MLRPYGMDFLSDLSGTSKVSLRRMCCKLWIESKMSRSMFRSCVSF